MALFGFKEQFAKRKKKLSLHLFTQVILKLYDFNFFFRKQKEMFSRMSAEQLLSIDRKW